MPADVAAAPEDRAVPAPGLFHVSPFFMPRALKGPQDRELAQVLDHGEHDVQGRLAGLVIECLRAIAPLPPEQDASLFSFTTARTSLGDARPP